MASRFAVVRRASKAVLLEFLPLVLDGAINTNELHAWLVARGVTVGRSAVARFAVALRLGTDASLPSYLRVGRDTALLNLGCVAGGLSENDLLAVVRYAKELASSRAAETALAELNEGGSVGI